MITNACIWPARIILAVGCGYASAHFILYNAIAIAIRTRNGIPFPFPEFLAHPTVYLFAIYSLIFLMFFVAFLWPRLLIWPTLLMLLYLTFFYFSSIRLIWEMQNYSAAFFFTNILHDYLFVLGLVTGLYFMGLLPVAWRLLRAGRARQPPEEPADRSDKNR